MKQVLFLSILLAAPLSAGASTLQVAEAAPHADVLIYGGTPAGIAAAISAGRHNQQVTLVEPTLRLGGLVTSGLSHTDFRTFEGITGSFLELSQAVQKHYRDTYGPDSPQAKGNFRGTHAEPKVNLLVFEQMLASHKNIRILRSHVLDAVALGRDDKTGLHHIDAATFTQPDGKRIELRAKVFIDATYEGDLMALAKVKYHVGREGRDVYGESLAPENGDAELQGYNFRLIVTTVESNRVTPQAPPGYKREDFLPLAELFKTGRLTKAFGKQGEPIVFKAQDPQLPHGKYDVNDVSRGLVRLSMPGVNTAWPDADAATRKGIFAEHRRWNVGLLYFIQNDPSMPEKVQTEAKRWGWCKDEFIDTDHLPPQLYVREARRMIGIKVFTEHDTDHAKTPTGHDARAVLHRDSIAMGDYGPNCHGTAHDGGLFSGRHTGEFYKPAPPYQIPLGVLLPREVDNLIVPGAASSSHVGFCALRLEPIWASLGQAAGHAAHFAIAESTPVQKVSALKVQQALHAEGAATVYVSDVLPGHADFAAVQWWATLGGLHGLAPRGDEPGQRGKHFFGQYFEPFPQHAAQLDLVLTKEVAKHWLALAGEMKLSADPLPQADGRTTRGDWIRAAFKGR
ncbi:MAG: FAD-dependent oxidoreductase [Phycisphaeraceae bacterium]